MNFKQKDQSQPFRHYVKVAAIHVQGGLSTNRLRFDFAKIPDDLRTFANAWLVLAFELHASVRTFRDTRVK